MSRAVKTRTRTFGLPPDREAVGAGAAPVALGVEAGGAQAFGQRGAELAARQRDPDHAGGAAGARSASRSRSAAKPEAGAGRPPAASASRS